MKDATLSVKLLSAVDGFLSAADAVRIRVHLHTCDYDHNEYRRARKELKAALKRYDQSHKA